MRRDRTGWMASMAVHIFNDGRWRIFAFLTTALLSGIGCKPNDPSQSELGSDRAIPSGGLFIIGGGNRDDAMIVDLLEWANAKDSGFILIIPWASEEPEASAIAIMDQLKGQGVMEHRILTWTRPDTMTSFLPIADRLGETRLVFFTGGDQVNLMQNIDQLDGRETLQAAYWRGVTMAGTSAGAAVMSERMITGRDRHTGGFLEGTAFVGKGKVEVGQGIGFIKNAIIDQHFTERNRLNRLWSVCMDYPTLSGIGIDESTILKVRSGMGVVAGEGGVVWLSPCRQKSNAFDRTIETHCLSRYLAGDTLPMVITYISEDVMKPAPQETVE